MAADILTDDTLLCILRAVSQKTLGRCSRVSKTWHQAAEDRFKELVELLEPSEVFLTADAACWSQKYALVCCSSVYAVGHGGYMQLATKGVSAHRSTVFEIDSAVFGARFRVRCLDSCGNHTVLVTTDGQAYGWGDNSSGQACLPTRGNCLPARVEVPPVRLVACASSATYFVSVDNRVLYFGSQSTPFKTELLPTDLEIIDMNSNGLLFRGGKMLVFSSMRFLQCPDPEQHAVALARQKYCTNAMYYVTDKGCVWGNDTDTGHRNAVCACAPDNDLLIVGTSDGWIRHGGTDKRATQFVDVQTRDRIVSITSGYEHYMAVNASGDIYMWGKDAYGQLMGVDSKNKPVLLDKALCANCRHGACGSSESYFW
eukprot:TRINITY_DN6492_c0_g1_i1.p1 TRINITY_DN6492_c0_g1~~TRINITY_DN6492_c0_g1_i1.p1  ORF type:complete len:371 (-),score=59.33 TRINITY_DN6492_c0_g1_i1:740-1852(-)